MQNLRLLRVFATSCLSLILFNQLSYSQVWNPSHKIGTIDGVYNFSYNQTPSQLVEIFPAAIPNTGLTYQWEQSSEPITGFTSISGATQSSYTIPSALSQTTYYKRKTTSGSNSIYSNTIKISVVSVNWEDLNYVREHNVQVTAITSWTAVDQLAIGSKLQTTTYVDGLGRSTQKVSKETATPPTGVSLWGDMVQFSQYDAYGREPVNYLPYITSSQPGKYKTAPLTEQPQYYTVNYSESSVFYTSTYDNSPLNRVMNVKKPGISWAAGSGVSAEYELNTTTDNVQKFSVDYVQGNAPLYNSAYPAKSLYKITATDEYGKKVVEFYDKFGRIILKKVQLDDSPASSYTGWICTYSVYDDFGLLRFQIQPEGVKYLEANSWSFAGTNGATILAEQVFQYYYDDQGRLTWKKAPGQAAQNMIYDIRDRLVFMQDGNQAALSTPQWTAIIFDELDRPLITTLYNTTQTRAQLQTDIDNAASSTTITVNNSGTYSVTATTHLNPVTSTSLNNSSVTTVLKYLFYDNYSFNAVKAFNTNYTNLNAYSTSDPNVIPIAKSLRTTSMLTGSMTRVLGTTTFLSSTFYIDEQANLIQSLEDNIKSGTDINTLQYHFDGRVLSSCTDHTVPNSGYTNYKILTKNLFDKLGRVTSIQKQFGSNAFKTIASYDYDDAGRLKTKHLDPGYTAGGNAELESLSYSYNIHNSITGINKDYALKTSGNYSKWGHFFGLYLGYDNKDNVFTNANLNGQVTGVLWNTQGDDAQRRYNYTYDNAGRLTNAAFTEKQHTGDAWSSSLMDFSISGTSGKITYDLNGNLLNMLHKGVLPGTASPITVDNLSYTYASYSNKLQTVTDQMTNTTVNGKFGDFKDGTNTSTPDYVYDVNGNLVIDLNKNAKDLAGVTGANGIKYNFLDKPEEIRIVGKGTIKIVYSAGGEKLQRIFTPEASGTIITASYVNQFIYQQTTTGGTTSDPELQLINFEEGRIRVITPVSQGNGYDALVIDGNMDLPNSKEGVYDYYIMDYLQNVRMILTEEIHTASNTATMETSRSTVEESVFGQVGGNNEVAVTRDDKPSAWTGNSTAKVSKLGTTAGHNVGPNTLQKVMAGDKVNASVLYYHTSASGGNNNNFLSTIAGTLVQAISGSGATSAVVNENASAITTQLGNTSGFVNAVQPNGSNPSGTDPQAYLTILFFDERFNFIPAADGGVAQQQVLASVSGNGAALALSDIKAPKNGYAYVYVSNQSNNNVYFDDFQVGITAGNIIEENHYYAYGLKISTLSSRKLGNSNEGNLKNNYLYQGAYNEFDDDISWNDFDLRNYDPQIGRWVQQDPYDLPFHSPYTGMGNDPINNVDPTGGIYITPTGITGKVLDEVVVYTARSAATSVLNKVINISTRVLQASNIINISLKTFQIGDPVPGNWYMRNNGNITYRWVYDGDSKGIDPNEWHRVPEAPCYEIIVGKSGMTKLTLNSDGTFQIISPNPDVGVVDGSTKWDMKLKSGDNLYIRARDYMQSKAVGDDSFTGAALTLGGGVGTRYLVGRLFARVAATGVAARSSNILKFTTKQLQAKFKHAGDFGVIGNYSKANAGKFSAAINQHINSAGVRAIQGTYKRQSVIHYLNPSTGVNVISKTSGEFISGWRLGQGQLQGVLKNGTLW